MSVTRRLDVNICAVGLYRISDVYYLPEYDELNNVV